MLDEATGFRGYENIRAEVAVEKVLGEEYYGKGYQDLDTRVPNIDNAKNYLGWQPTTDLRTAIRKTIAYYLP